MEFAILEGDWRYDMIGDWWCGSMVPKALSNKNYFEICCQHLWILWSMPPDRWYQVNSGLQFKTVLLHHHWSKHIGMNNGWLWEPIIPTVFYNKWFCPVLGDFFAWSPTFDETQQPFHLHASSVDVLVFNRGSNLFKQLGDFLLNGLEMRQLPLRGVLQFLQSWKQDLGIGNSIRPWRFAVSLGSWMEAKLTIFADAVSDDLIGFPNDAKTRHFHGWLITKWLDTSTL